MSPKQIYSVSYYSYSSSNGVFLVAMLISSLNDKLYLCGTTGGITTSFISRNSVISSVLSIDVYNKEQDTWEHCSDTVIAHHNAGTTSVSSLIYFSDQSIQVSRIDFPKPQQPLILIGGVFETKIYQLVIFLQTLDSLMLNHNGHHNVIKAHIPYSSYSA
jgi:hypothetical protein